MAPSKKTIENLKVIIDANVLFRGSLHPRFAFEILNHALKGDFKLFLIPYTIEEAIRNIAKRYPDRLPYLELFLTRCSYKLLKDPPKYELENHINLIRDHKDLPLAVAATKNKLDYLVSNDKDFTATDDTTKKIKKKITCLTAGNFLKEIMGWTSENLEKIQRRKWEELEQENYRLWGVDFRLLETEKQG